MEVEKNQRFFEPSKSKILEVKGICNICGRVGKMYTCSLCGNIVCGECYNIKKGVCRLCERVPRRI